MQVKTYRGKSIHSVMERIKAELGIDAVILSTRNYTDGGEKLCEITAGVEPGARAPQPEPGPEHAQAVAEAMERVKAARGGGGQPVAKAGAEQKLRPVPTKAEIAAENPDTPAPGWEQMHREWSSIKGHLMAFMKPQMDFGALSPRQRLALEHLEKEGVSDDVIMTMFGELKNDSAASVLAPLARIARTRGWNARNWPTTYHAFAGPHGAGKTTAMVRMALFLKAAQPDLRICLVNADCSRGAGRLLLKRYADLVGLSYREVSNPVEFAALQRECEQFDKVLVDMPGLARGETLDEALARIGATRAGDLKAHLVLAPYYSRAQYRAIAAQYHSQRLASLIWTKLDETCTFGELVNVAADTGLPVSAVSFGPELKGTLIPADSETLWRALFKHELPGMAATGQGAAA